MGKHTPVDWQSASKRHVGDKSGGGSVGAAKSAPKAGLGSKHGGKPQSGGPTPFGSTSGGGAGPKGKAHALNAPKGIGLRSKG